MLYQSKGSSLITYSQKTDDVGVFCSSLSQEYYLAATHFNLTLSQLKKLCEEAVEIIFGGLEEKERLRALYRQWDGWVVRI